MILHFSFIQHIKSSVFLKVFFLLFIAVLAKMDFIFLLSHFLQLKVQIFENNLIAFLLMIWEENDKF